MAPGEVAGHLTAAACGSSHSLLPQIHRMCFDFFISFVAYFSISDLRREQEEQRVCWNSAGLVFRQPEQDASGVCGGSRVSCPSLQPQQGGGCFSWVSDTLVIFAWRGSGRVLGLGELGWGSSLEPEHPVCR